MSKVTPLTQLAAILLANTSAVKVHEYPPESLGELPCFVLEYTSGELGMAAASALTNEMLTVVAALYISRQVLPLASTDARPYIDEVRDALNANASLGGTVLTVEGLRFEGPGALAYTEVIGRPNLYYGIRFEIDFRQKENVTWSLS